MWTALTRPVSPSLERCELTHLQRTCIDMDRAQAQHAAYEAALALNLTFRKLGLEEALESRRTSRYHAANQAREALRMDAHLADVLVMV